MSVARSMLLRAEPQALARRLSAAVDREAIKGCIPDISPVPVRLEPPFLPVFVHAAPDDALCSLHARLEDDMAVAPVKLRVWISPEQKFDWKHSELWLKQLACASDRIGFQITGNQKAIEVLVLCAPNDELLVKTAFEAQFNMCEITSSVGSCLDSVQADAWAQSQFLEFFPPPPYSHMLTCSSELHTSPFEALLTTMRLVPETAIAFYQCIFQPVAPANDWHRNVSQLLDLEFAVKLHNSPASSFRALQQTPSGDLHRMAGDVEIKAHNDKPFFATVVRIGVVGLPSADDRFVRPLASMMRLFQHGGRPLECVSQRDYQACLGGTRIRCMFLDGRAHRAGFLLNSQELAGLVHLFPLAMVEPRKIPVESLPGLPLRTSELSAGTDIGVCRYAGVDHRVCIPLLLREKSVHAISSSGMGKTTILMNILLEDIPTLGAAFIDPHGDAVKDLLRHIPESCRHRCVYFNPGDNEWIPLWNPLCLPPGGSVYRLADDLVAVCKRVFPDWGDRLEHVIRNGFIGLGQLQNACLADLYELTRRKSEESKALRRQIISTCADDPVRKFWDDDFLEYNKNDLQAPKHKLSKLVSAGPVSWMLSQPQSLLTFRDIMDNKQILLIDLSTVGAELCDVLGSFMLTLFLMAARSRGDTEEALRNPFSIFIDEAPLFVSADSIGKLITEARKFHVNICLANQYLKQFKSTQIDAIASVGTSLIGHLDEHDSQFFVRHLQGKVKPEDIMALRRGEFIARIGNEIVNLRSNAPRDGGDTDGAREIIENSRRRYCRPASEVRQWIRNRSFSRQEPFALADQWGALQSFSEEELRYEQF